jgi:flagellar motor switch protein FliN/FliY
MMLHPTQELEPPANPVRFTALSEDQKLRNLENIEVKLTVEAGSTNITVRDLLRLNVGSVVELNTLAGEHLNIRANGTLILKGEIVSISEILGIRVTDIVSADQRATDHKE